MSEVRFSPQCYTKIMLHAAKYPHCSVNGVLLAENTKNKDGKKKGVHYVDAIPLFHICLHVSPMAEIALTQIDSYAAAEGLVIAGYYVANENLGDMSIDKPANRLADKIAEVNSSACLVVVDNKKITLSMDEVAINVLHLIDGKWKPMDPTGYFVDQLCLDAAFSLIHDKSYDDLVDFDNHLDNISLDWKNPEINDRIANLSTMLNEQ